MRIITIRRLEKTKRRKTLKNAFKALCWRGSTVEQLICNQQVGSSILFASSINGGIPEWPKGTDCKSVSSAFDGSNPSPSTKYAEVAQW